MVVYELSDDTNNIKMHRLFAEIIVRKNENSFFHKHFLNMDSHSIFHVKLSNFQHVFMRKCIWLKHCIIDRPKICLK